MQPITFISFLNNPTSINPVPGFTFLLLAPSSTAFNYSNISICLHQHPFSDSASSICFISNFCSFQSSTTLLSNSSSQLHPKWSIFLCTSCSWIFHHAMELGSYPTISCKWRELGPTASHGWWTTVNFSGFLNCTLASTTHFYLVGINVDFTRGKALKSPSAVSNIVL